jgi:hypothetical protein
MEILTPVDPKIESLIKYIKDHPFCEITIIVQHGVPVLIEKVTEKIKL